MAIMNKLLSVIVPVYKVESYLKRCVDSILGQTYSNLEVILVDDGSPDRCGEICDYYAKKDSRVKVVHKENGGLSDARNAGLDCAKGEIISFIDSDDWIEESMYTRLIENMERFHSDVSVGGVTDILEKDEGYEVVKTTQTGEIVNWSCGKEEAMKKYFQGAWSAWDKIYVKSIFDTLRFPKGEINEDEAIVLQILDQCKVVAYTNESFYNYIKRENSITTSSFSVKKLAWKKHCRENLLYVKERYPELIPAAVARYRLSLIWLVQEVTLTKEKLDLVGRSLQQECRENKSVFRGIPFSNRIEQAEYLMVIYFPYWVFRCILVGYTKWKRRKSE